MRQCTSVCWYAKGPVHECKCICGGENHGRLTPPEDRITDEKREQLAEAERRSVPGSYTGTPVSGIVVGPDGQALDPGRSLSLRRHSPTGFAWGYGGSGPAQLALAILLNEGLEQDKALQLYQRFKFAVIAHHSWAAPLLLSRDTVRAWIGANV